MLGGSSALAVVQNDYAYELQERLGIILRVRTCFR